MNKLLNYLIAIAVLTRNYRPVFYSAKTQLHWNPYLKNTMFGNRCSSPSPFSKKTRLARKPLLYTG